MRASSSASRRTDYPGDPLGRHRVPAPLGIARLRSAAATTKRPAQLVGDFLAGRPRRSSAQSMPSYKPGVTPDRSRDLPARFRDRGDPRGAARLRPADHGLRHAGRRADRRRDAHLVADPHHARRRLAEPEREVSIRPAKARAMPAASFRRRSTASRSPRRWRCMC